MSINHNLWRERWAEAGSRTYVPPLTNRAPHHQAKPAHTIYPAPSSKQVVVVPRDSHFVRNKTKNPNQQDLLRSLHWFLRITQAIGLIEIKTHKRLKMNALLIWTTQNNERNLGKCFLRQSDERTNWYKTRNVVNTKLNVTFEDLQWKALTLAKIKDWIMF